MNHWSMTCLDKSSGLKEEEYFLEDGVITFFMAAWLP